MAKKSKRILTDYGKWIKTVLMDKDMNMRDLEKASGVEIQYISKIMYGYFPGHKYRAKMERALGENPPEGCAC